jgi:hypothetical protein
LEGKTMAQKVKITYYGVEAEGRNLTEAKKAAGKKIEKAMTASYTPEVIAWRGNAVLIYRTPEGWCSANLMADGVLYERDLSGSWWGRDGEDWAAVVAAVRLHLAQQGWEPADGEEVPEVLRNSPKLHGEYRSWVKFQLRYRDAVARGMGSNDAHDYAGRNPARTELWAHEADAHESGVFKTAKTGG